jgi:acyl dehydratase
MAKPALIQELEGKIGQEIGVSDWFLVEQEAIDIFGSVTDDIDPMHNDPEWGRAGPFGGTIAHGMFTLSLLPRFARELGFPVLTDETAHAINYGFDRVRLIDPVPVGGRVRNRMVLDEVREKGPGRYLVRTTNTIECEGSAKPCVVAEWLSLYVYT